MTKHTSARKVSAKAQPVGSITERIDPERIYQDYNTGKTSPVIEYTAWDRGTPIGPFFTWGAANLCLTARQYVRASQAKRASFRASLAA